MMYLDSLGEFLQTFAEGLGVLVDDMALLPLIWDFP